RLISFADSISTFAFSDTYGCTTEAAPLSLSQ
ncbi:hypothetical protein CEXT_508761, partial [Caerostris extrusa]